MPQIITPHSFAAFSDELMKVALKLPGTPKEKAIAAASGVATLGTYIAGKRIVDDVRMAEQMRRGGY